MSVSSVDFAGNGQKEAYSSSTEAGRQGGVAVVKHRRWRKRGAQAVCWTHLGLQERIAVMPCGLQMPLCAHACHDGVADLNPQ